MRKSRIFLMMLSCCISFISMAQVPFTAGNLVVLRVGDGSIPLSNRTFAVFMDEYSPSGTLIQSILLPTGVSGSNQIFTLKGFGNDPGVELGTLTLSTNGQWLTAAGFSVPLLTPNSTTNSSTDRTIGLVKYDGSVNTTTKLSDAGPGFPYSAVTTNGTDIWANFDFVLSSNSGGLRYATTGSSTSTNIFAPLPGLESSYRIAGINNNQLYLTSETGVIPTVGTGLPTTGPQTTTALPGFTSLGIGHQISFFFADLNAGIPGSDVLYVTDLSAGLRKYSFDGTTWVSNGSIGVDTDNYFGITGAVTGNTVTLYCTRKMPYANLPGGGPDSGGANGGGELVSLTDASGYNGTLTATPTVLATAAFQTAFRGVAFAPQPPSVKVSAKAFLQGAYNTSLSRHKDVTTAWANVLNANALTQPFNVAPFNYAGTEHVSAGFFTSTAGVNTDITDWVLLELRDATTPATIISRQAALIREDGQIVDVDGVSPVPMTATAGVADGNYYIVVKHRNHLAIRSANPVALNGTTVTLYDFTDDQNKAFQNPSVPGNTAMATKDLPGTETGKFLLWGGNANGDGFIRASGASNVSDYLTLLGPLCLQGDFSKILNSVYRKEDMNLDGVVRASAALNVNDYITLLSAGILAGNTSNIIAAH